LLLADLVFFRSRREHPRRRHRDAGLGADEEVSKNWFLTPSSLQRRYVLHGGSASNVNAPIGLARGCPRSACRRLLSHDIVNGGYFVTPTKSRSRRLSQRISLYRRARLSMHVRKWKRRSGTGLRVGDLEVGHVNGMHQDPPAMRTPSTARTPTSSPTTAPTKAFATQSVVTLPSAVDPNSRSARRDQSSDNNQTSILTRFDTHRLRAVLLKASWGYYLQTFYLRDWTWRSSIARRADSNRRQRG